MLTEEERARIRAEEIFRLEVRAELEANKPVPSRRQRLGKWVNTSFGLWVMSSIVLTALTTSFTYFQNMRAAQGRKAEIERRLDTEISGRMSAALARFRVDKLEFAHGSFEAPADIYGDLGLYLDNFFVNNPSNPQDLSIYPEYQKRNFRSLLFELSTIVKPSELPQVRDALKGYMRFKDLASVPDNSAGADKRKRESLQATNDLTEFLSGQMQGRWQSKM